MDDIVAIEKRFWLEGPAFYDANTTDDCVMVFAEPVGDLDKQQVLEAIADGPRWADVKIVEPTSRELSRDVILLVYLAQARQEDGTGYETMASSLYVRRDDSWKLAFHQQSQSLDD